MVLLHVSQKEMIGSFVYVQNSLKINNRTVLKFLYLSTIVKQGEGGGCKPTYQGQRGQPLLTHNVGGPLSVCSLNDGVQCKNRNNTLIYWIAIGTSTEETKTHYWARTISSSSTINCLKVANDRLTRPYVLETILKCKNTNLIACFCLKCNLVPRTFKENLNSSETLQSKANGKWQENSLQANCFS